MRAEAVLAMLCCTVVLAPSLEGQSAPSSPPPAVVVSDPAGDVVIRSFQFNASAPAGTYAHVDVREVWISNETTHSFQVGFRLEKWEDPTNGQETAARYVQVGFGFANGFYVAQFGPGLDGTPCPPNKGTFIRGDLDDFVGPNRNRNHSCLNLTVEPSQATVNLEVPKNLVKSHNGLPLQIGDSITSLAGEARQLVGAGLARDRAPNSGYGDAFLVRQGPLAGAGDIGLLTKVPVRASNGESTTMVFRVRLVNQGTTQHVVSLGADVPNPEWTVRLPPRLRIAPQQTVDFPAILSMNFSHEHGATQFFTVKAVSVADPLEAAKIKLGVHWLEIPQPAGHHDRLWFHSAPLLRGHPLDPVYNLQTAWMNALETDPRPTTTDAEIYGQSYFPCGYSDIRDCAKDMDVVWRIALDPKLQIGIDLDETRQGSLDVRLRPSLPANQAFVNATVYYCKANATRRPYEDRCGGGTGPVDILYGQSQADSLAANTEKTFKVPLRVNASAGLVDFEPGRNLEILIRLRPDLPQGVGGVRRAPTVTLVPKASQLTLPLFEYHDPIDQSFQNLGAITLRALDPFEKPVNPGRSVVFRFDLTNVGTEDHDLRLGVEGINAAWARVHEGDTLTLGRQERRQATLVVDVPEDAQPGERAELFFVAESTKDPSIVALGRVRATVVDPAAQAVPDETPTISIGTDSKTSALPVAIVTVVVLAVAVLPRRRT